MSSLAVSLNTVGISRAQGVELIAQREQLDATLPRESAASAAAKKPAEDVAAKPRPKERPNELTPEERRVVAELQQIDRTVRAHEQAHLQAGRGVVTSGASFTYTYGPDGRQYAVAGEVGIDTSRERKPEANIDKGRRIQAAALAPKDPSPQDYRVASIGGQIEAQGHSDLVRQQRETQAIEAERGRQAREEAVRQAYEQTQPQSQPGSTQPEGDAPREPLSVFV